MKGIPFYLTPEEFDAHEQAFIQQLKEAEPKEYWNCANRSGAGRYSGLLLSLALGLVTVLTMACAFLVLGFITDGSFSAPIELILSPMFYGPALLICGVSYLQCGVDNLYHYHLSDKGLLMEYHQHIPKFAYSILRGIAWIGCIVSVLAMAKFGAAAFAGAGGSLLLAFGLTRMKQDVFSDIVLPSYVHSITYNRSRCVIEVFYYSQGCMYTDDQTKEEIRRFIGGELRCYIFCNNDEQLEYMISRLESEYKCTKIQEISNEKQFFNRRRPEDFNGDIYPFDDFLTSELPNLIGKPAPTAPMKQS